MRVRSLLLAAVLCALAFVAIAPTASAQSGFIPVANQQLSLGNAGTGTLTAVKITKIANQGGQLVASGLAAVTTSTGTVIGSFTNAPLQATQTPTGPNTCPILHLDNRIDNQIGRAGTRNLKAEDWQCPPEEPKKIGVSRSLGKDSSLDAGYFLGNGADVLKPTGCEYERDTYTSYGRCDVAFVS